MNNENVVFVGGAMRSGTTILHRVLCTAAGSHPYISEAWFLLDLVRLYRATLGGYEIRGLDFFGPRTMFDARMLAMVEAHVGDLARRYYPASRVFLKHPELTAHFPLLGRWFPRSPLVVNIRDPRDTIASMLEVTEKQRAAGAAPMHAAGPRDIKTLCRVFLDHYRWMDDLPPDQAKRVTLVRYETLMGEPARALAELEAALGLSFDRSRLQAFGETREASANLDPAYRGKHPFYGAYFSELYNRNLTAERIGRHVEVLTGPEIAEVERLCAGFAARHGYW